MTERYIKRPRFRFTVFALVLFVFLVAMFCAVWRALGTPAVLVLGLLLPFGLLIYFATSLFVRYPHPMTVGVLIGTLVGLLGSVLQLALDRGTEALDKFAHLTVTGLAIGVASGVIIALKRRSPG